MEILFILVGILLSNANGASYNSTKIGQRIVGGYQAASIGQFPYVASLRQPSGQLICGGSIISNSWILTAAHCVHGSRPQNIVVVVGSLRISRGGFKYLVRTIVVHPNYNPFFNPTYNPPQYANDIAMLKLAVKIRFGPTIQPIAIGPNYIGKARSVLGGWGKTSYSGTTSDTLRYIYLNTISEADCRQRLGPSVRGSNICTYTRRGEGSCRGDSGGPLVAYGRQIGIVSFGTRVCATGMPDVFTRTSTFYQWILRTMSR